MLKGLGCGSCLVQVLAVLQCDMGYPGCGREDFLTPCLESQRGVTSGCTVLLMRRDYGGFLGELSWLCIMVLMRSGVRLWELRVRESLFKAMMCLVLTFAAQQGCVFVSINDLSEVVIQQGGEAGNA
eukprot:310840-Pelagomonas_calceolata.AAC.1